MIDRLLIAHPRSVGETYFEHLGASLNVAARLAAAAAACVVHAVVPGLCTTTASRAIAALHADIQPRLDRPEP